MTLIQAKEVYVALDLSLSDDYDAVPQAMLKHKSSRDIQKKQLMITVWELLWCMTCTCTCNLISLTPIQEQVKAEGLVETVIKVELEVFDGLVSDGMVCS